MMGNDQMELFSSTGPSTGAVAILSYKINEMNSGLGKLWSYPVHRTDREHQCCVCYLYTAPEKVSISHPSGGAAHLELQVLHLFFPESTFCFSCATIDLCRVALRHFLIYLTLEYNLNYADYSPCHTQTVPFPPPSWVIPVIIFETQSSKG